MTQSQLRRLGIPEQTLQSLTMCSADKKGVEDWLGSLPTANIGETTKQLYSIIAELMKLQTPADNRLELLEILAPRIDSNIDSLSRHYQHKRAILPQKAQKVVDLTHALRMCVANNYTISAVELASALSASKGGLLRRSNKLQATAAINGAVKALKEDLLLSYKLFSAAKPSAWVKMHQLYSISVDLNVHDHPNWGETGEADTISQAYAQALMLGSIKANQLRQDDLVRTAALISGWTSMVSIDSYSGGEIPALFMINRGHDRGPVFSHLLSKEALAECKIQFSTTELVQHIRQLVDEADGPSIKVDGKAVGIDLLNHLILAWGKCTKRSFMRIEAHDKLEICVGLGIAHKFAAGEVDIASMLQKADVALAREAMFGDLQGEDGGDSADSANQTHVNQPTGSVENIQYEGLNVGGTGKHDSAQAVDELTVNVKVNNASPGGYSLSLPGNHDIRIHAGDLIGLRDDRSEMWSIGAVRWLHRSAVTEVTFGVELLSPAFVPSIARAVSMDGKTGEYVPVLLLPEISVTKQSASLLISECNVQAGQTMQVLDREQVRMVRMTEQITKTRSYLQYGYENFEASNDDTSVDLENAGQPFDEELWGNL